MVELNRFFAGAIEQIKNEWRGYSDESERGAVAT
jgi:hypothetical protein